MSQSRCGLQVSRDLTITKDYHNHPRRKQIGCLVGGNVGRPGESMITSDVAEEELENRREIAKVEKMDVGELSLRKITKGIEGLLPTEQKGEGTASLLLKLVNILPVRKIGESIAANISNIFPDSDENARNIFPGENHAIVKLPNGKFGRANYTGPGTRIVERLRREPGGDPPRVLSDKVSQAHDLRYSLAKNEDDVRKADLKMLSSLSDLKRDRQDRNTNIIPAMIGIRGKIVAENFGLLSRNAFISTSFKPSASDIQLMQSKLKELEQQGFGAPLSKARVPFTSSIGKRNQVEQIGTVEKSVPQARNSAKQNLRKGPQYLDPQPGTSSTQSLAGIYGDDARRGVHLDRRGNQSSLGSRLKPQLNTRGEFRNRRSGVSQTGSGRARLPSGMHGGYQVPGMASSTGHQMIDIKTSKIVPKRSTREQIRRKPMEGGKGNPGVSPIQVQTGSGAHRRSKKASLPGRALLAKLSKKIQGKRGIQIRGGRRKPIFADEHRMSKILAEKLLPMIAV